MESMESVEGSISEQEDSLPKPSVGVEQHLETSATPETRRRSLLGFVTGLLRSVLRREKAIQFSGEAAQNADPETRIIQLEARRRYLLDRIGIDNTGSGVIIDRKLLDDIEGEIAQLKPSNTQSSNGGVNNQTTDKAA